MSSLFNSALRQSASIRKDLDALDEASSKSTPTSALQGQLTTSLTSFSRTLDEYQRATSAELVPEKKARDEERLANYRSELLDYRSRFAQLKHSADEASSAAARSELLGRRPHASGTPETPYSDTAVASSSRQGPNANPLFRTNNPNFQPSNTSGANPYSSYQSPYALSTGAGGADQAREQHAFKEQSFFGAANQTLDEYIERGRAVLGDLGEQREVLKGTQKKLYSVANTLGISGDTIRMVERRAKQDKFIFWAGVVVFVIFVYFVLRWLR